MTSSSLRSTARMPVAADTVPHSALTAGDDIASASLRRTGRKHGDDSRRDKTIGYSNNCSNSRSPSGRCQAADSGRAEAQSRPDRVNGDLTDRLYAVGARRHRERVAVEVGAEL